MNRFIRWSITYHICSPQQKHSHFTLTAVNASTNNWAMHLLHYELIFVNELINKNIAHCCPIPCSFSPLIIQLWVPRHKTQQNIYKRDAENQRLHRLDVSWWEELPEVQRKWWSESPPAASWLDEGAMTGAAAGQSEVSQTADQLMLLRPYKQTPQYGQIQSSEDITLKLWLLQNGLRSKIIFKWLVH